MKEILHFKLISLCSPLISNLFSYLQPHVLDPAFYYLFTFIFVKYFKMSIMLYCIYFILPYLKTKLMIILCLQRVM